MKLVKNLKGHTIVKDCSPKSKVRGKFGVLLSMVMLFSITICGIAFAGETGGTVNTGTIDTGTFTTIITGAKAVLGLFTEFPINVFLAASILGIAIGVVTKVKKSS